ncbi:sialidase family protein [Dactylosporangium sp. CS-047395]|uniref:sialidase family protein n=1 Tax=Dactylosporangium sp. CS-047395 TaxID=3239936 RepID=UPI003D910B0F
MAAVLASVAVVVGLLASPAAAVSQLQKLYQEPGSFEARFPDIVKLDDGRLMAVWYRATGHTGPDGTVQLSFGAQSGTAWDAPHPALAHPATMAGKDMRDPKLGKMHDGSVVLTFFVPSDGVYYSVWKPGWTTFTDPVKLPVPAQIQGSALAAHGGMLALDDQGGQTSQVLIPVYNNTGAWFIRATWRPVSDPRLLVADAFQLAATATTPDANGFYETYTEPSFVQVGGVVIAAVRRELNNNSSTNPISNGQPVKIMKWNPYTFTGTGSYYDVQWLSGVWASSHHLLKVSGPSGDRVLFTFGDKAVTARPTYGVLIQNPLALWPSTPKKVLIYNSGSSDQANPSSVETSSGTYFTLAYNAKPKSTTEGNGMSPNGGSLWVMQSSASEY